MNSVRPKNSKTMKTLIFAALAALTAATMTSAADKTAHDKKHMTPNGGRLLTKVDPHMEFLVLPDRKVQLSFVDEGGRIVAPTTQVVTLITGERMAPTKLTFAKVGDVLISDGVLPAGGNLPAVVQIKEKVDAKAVVEKFNINLAHCGECNRAEYACICEDHAHEK